MYLKEFDITDKVIAFAKESIKDMPGNNGQEVLVNDLEFDGNASILYSNDNGDRQAQQSHDFRINSHHPEAINIIIDYAYQSIDLICSAAETILDVFSPDEWIIAGYDG